MRSSSDSRSADRPQSLDGLLGHLLEEALSAHGQQNTQPWVGRSDEVIHWPAHAGMRRSPVLALAATLCTWRKNEEEPCVGPGCHIVYLEEGWGTREHWGLLQPDALFLQVSHRKLPPQLRLIDVI
ncbi:unnamed protein product [Boreogadus saida]